MFPLQSKHCCQPSSNSYNKLAITSSLETVVFVKASEASNRSTGLRIIPYAKEEFHASVKRTPVLFGHNIIFQEREKEKPFWDNTCLTTWIYVFFSLLVVHYLVLNMLGVQTLPNLEIGPGVLRSDANVLRPQTPRERDGPAPPSFQI